jgi:hypothetical protein
LVNGHPKDIVCPVDSYNPHSSSVMRINTGANTSELLGSIIEGNNDVSLRIEEMLSILLRLENLMIVSP